MNFEFYKEAYKTLHYADSRKSDHKKPEGYATEQLNRTTSQAVGGAIGGAIGAVGAGTAGYFVGKHYSPQDAQSLGLISAYYGGGVGGAIGATISDFRSIRRGDRQAGYKSTNFGKYFVRGLASTGGAIAGGIAGAATGSTYGIAGGATLGALGADYAVRKSLLKKDTKKNITTLESNE